MCDGMRSNSRSSPWSARVTRAAEQDATPAVRAQTRPAARFHGRHALTQRTGEHRSGTAGVMRRKVDSSEPERNCRRLHARSAPGHPSAEFPHANATAHAWCTSRRLRRRRGRTGGLEFAFGLEPVFDVVPRCASAREVQVVRVTRHDVVCLRSGRFGRGVRLDVVSGCGYRLLETGSVGHGVVPLRSERVSVRVVLMCVGVHYASKNSTRLCEIARSMQRLACGRVESLAIERCARATRVSDGADTAPSSLRWRGRARASRARRRRATRRTKGRVSYPARRS